MNTVTFATCERGRAIDYLRRVYPSTDPDTVEELAGDLLELVEADIVRICDPAMYGSNIEVVPGTNWTESAEERERVASIARDFHERTTAAAGGES